MDEDALNTSVLKFQETTPCPFPGPWTFSALQAPPARMARRTVCLKQPSATVDAEHAQQ